MKVNVDEAIDASAMISDEFGGMIAGTALSGEEKTTVIVYSVFNTNVPVVIELIYVKGIVIVVLLVVLVL